MIAELGLASLQALLTAQCMKNLSLFPTLESSDSVAGEKVSVLLPMRNEEENCERLLRELIENRESVHEIIVLDDESTDRTPEILSRFVDAHPGLVKVYSGSPRPRGWQGKLWAMEQLRRLATSDLLLFIDTDVRLSPGALRAVTQYRHSKSLDFLTVFPSQITTPATQLLVNHLFTTLLYLLPMQLVQDPKYPGAVAGCGQVQLVRKEALEAIGAYDALRHTLHDGLKTARAMKRAQRRVGFCYGNGLIQCQMYPNLPEAWGGFVRNAWEATGGLTPLVLTSGLLLLAFVAGPLHLLRYHTISLTPLLSTLVLYWSAHRALRKLKLRRSFVLLLPVSILLSTATQWTSYIRHRMGRSSVWKGRSTNVEPA